MEFIRKGVLQQQHKVARWIKELPMEPPKDPADRPHVVQHLFKVTPPMEWTEGVVYRHGKLISDDRRRGGNRRRGMPNRMRVQSKRMEAARKAGKPFDWSEPQNPRYFYSQRHHKTSFVVASASDLKTYMNAANRRMAEVMKERGDIEGERLFRREDHFEVETYLFPADKFGEIKTFGELAGSQRGTLDHRVPLQDAGYIVIGMPYNLVLYGESVDLTTTTNE